MSNKRTPATADNFGELRGAGAEVDNLDDHNIAILNRAVARWQNSSDMRESFEAWALEEAAHQRKFSPQRFFEVRRWQEHVDDSGEREAIDNSHVPLFTRFLLLEHPDLRQWCELRRSHWDALFAGVASRGA